MRKLGLLVVFIVSATLLAAPVMASGATRGGGTSEFYLEQTYPDWYTGPNIYYGQPVTVKYYATNTWTWIEYKNGDVRENLVQEGYAEIYDQSGNLIDTRDFSALEKFYDKGGDACTKCGEWYKPGWWSPDTEWYHYIWRIQGVYEFELWGRDGQWTYTFTAYTAPPTVISGP